MRKLPETQEQLLEIRELVMSRPLYVDYLIDKTGQYSAIILEMNKSSVDQLEDIMFDPEKGTALDNLYPQVSDTAIRNIISSPEFAGIEFFQTGDVAMNAAYNNVFMSDSSVGIPLTFLLLAVFSLILFRASMLGLIGPLAVAASQKNNLTSPMCNPSYSKWWTGAPRLAFVILGDWWPVAQ